MASRYIRTYWCTSAAAVRLMFAQSYEPYASALLRWQDVGWWLIKQVCSAGHLSYYATLQCNTALRR